VLAENEGVLSWVLTDPESVAFTPRVWVEHRPGHGEVAVAEVCVVDPKSGGRYRIIVEPAHEDVTLLSPAEVMCDGVARFEFKGPVPGSAALRVRAVDMPRESPAPR